jgi:hypothetical protein
MLMLYGLICVSLKEAVSSSDNVASNGKVKKSKVVPVLI